MILPVNEMCLKVCGEKKKSGIKGCRSAEWNAVNMVLHYLKN